AIGTHRNYLKEISLDISNTNSMNNDADMSELEGRRCSCAIYAVEHLMTGKRLICCTSNLSKRLYDQRKALASGTHFNAGVQADLKQRDGAAAFEIVVLELCDDPTQLRKLKAMHVADATNKGVELYNSVK